MKFPTMSNIFGSTPQTSGPAMNPGVNPANVNPAAQNPQNTPQANLATVNTAATAPNGLVPQTSADSVAAQQTQQSGMAKYNDLWQNPTTPAPQGQPLFNISMDQINEAARKQNFTGEAATPEQIAAVAAGGEAAVQAMLQIVNSVGQNVYAQSAVATTKLIEGALDKKKFASTEDVESKIRQFQVGTSLSEVNPVFNSPAAQPIIEGLKAQFLTKFPNASPKEITSMVNDYLSNFASEFNAPARTAEQNAAVKKADDWGKFFGE